MRGLLISMVRRQIIHFGSSIKVTIVRHKSLVNPLNITQKNMESFKCKVVGLDHLVLTVKDIDKSVKFYKDALGMTLVTFGEGRKALQFGNQKINLHQCGREFKPHAKKPTSGSADICFVSKEGLNNWISHLNQLGIKIEEGPVKRTGAVGPITSIYVRDPDDNLVEIANY